MIDSFNDNGSVAVDVSGTEQYKYNGKLDGKMIVLYDNKAISGKAWKTLWQHSSTDFITVRAAFLRIADRTVPYRGSK